MLDSLGFAPDHPELRRLEARATAEPIHSSYRRLGYVGAYVVRSDDEKMTDQACEVLADDYYIMPDVPLSLPQPQVTQQYLRRPSRDWYWPDDSGIPQAHKDGIRGQGVLVGVLDTGCDADHIELRDKRIDFRYVPLHPQTAPVRSVRGFDVDGHGTHVCGIIGGKNVGVAPDADLMVAAVIESETWRTSMERMVIALNWMLSHFQLDENLNKPTIINMSLGFQYGVLQEPELQTVLDGLQKLLETLVVDFNVLPIVAIGNDGPGIVRAPGDFPETLSVGAVDFDKQPAFFSGGGISPLTNRSEPNIVGYGVDVLSSFERTIEKRSVYAEMSGTSMATPYVTGVAALWCVARFPNCRERSCA